jgi:hypothetical protein
MMAALPGGLVGRSAADVLGSAGSAATLGDALTPDQINKAMAGMLGHTCVSITTLYLGAMVGMFILAGLFHPNEAFDLVHGIWYLLCLPGGYLFLTIYSFANLDDRSWGTREEKVAASGQGDSWLSALCGGCGRVPGESALHFIGRLLTCRLGSPPTIAAAKGADPAMPWKLKTRRAAWRLNSDASRATCVPIDELLAFLREHGAEPDKAPARLARLAELTRAAVAACPPLLARGTWPRCWDAANARFRTPRAPPSPADPAFWEAMATEIAQYVDRTYTWDVVPREPLEYAAGVKPTARWLAEVGVGEAFVVEACVAAGYTDTTFFVGVKEDDLVAIGLLDTLTGRASVAKILEAAEKLPKNDIPDAIPPTLDDWLRSFNLECYAANFARAGYLQADLRFMEYLDVRPRVAGGGALCRHKV